MRFVLIHGANGQPSGFQPLRAELERRGHDVAAPELPIEDKDATFADYAAAVPDGDVIVGHSMGGVTASLVARRAGAQVGYLAALLPRQGSTLAQMFGEMLCPEVAPALVRRDGLDFFARPEAVGLDPRFLRGQALAPYFEPLDDPVPGLYVVCARDRVVRPDYQRSVPLEKVELDCGHDVFRERPRELADILGA